MEAVGWIRGYAVWDWDWGVWVWVWGGVDVVCPVWDVGVGWWVLCVGCGGGGPWGVRGGFSGGYLVWVWIQWSREAEGRGMEERRVGLAGMLG